MLGVHLPTMPGPRSPPHREALKLKLPKFLCPSAVSHSAFPALRFPISPQNRQQQTTTDMAHLGAASAAAAAAAHTGEDAFWTACPHCCYVHSYPRLYLGRRLLCPTPACRRAFHAAELPAAPPVVPGADMYFCTWAFFPLGPPSSADGWAPFTPFHQFKTPRSPSPASDPAAASADTPSRAGPVSRRKVGVCLKGRARAEAEAQEEEEEAAANLEAQVEEGGLGENGIRNIDINEAVDLSELGFRVDEIGILHELP